MIVQAEVVDRDGDKHLLRTTEVDVGGLLQATFEEMGFRIGSLLTVNIKPAGEVEVVSC